MVNQYPDTATIPGKSTESSIVGGIITPGISGNDIVQKGRYEPTTLNRELYAIDGQDVKLKGIFYSPLNTPDVDISSTISIVNKLGKSILVNSKVLFFERGELGCRLYV